MTVTIQTKHGETVEVSDDEYHTVEKRTVGPDNQFSGICVYDGEPHKGQTRYKLYDGEIVKVE